MTLDCRDVHERLARGESEGMSEHLDRCSVCSELAQGGALAQTLGSAQAPGKLDGALLWQATERELARESHWLRLPRNLATPSRLALLAASVVLLLAVIALFMRRADWAIFPTSRLIGTIAGSVGVAALGAWVGLRPVHRLQWSRSRQWLFACCAVALTFVPALLPEAHHAHPASLAGTGDDLARRAFGCFAWGSVMALATLVLFSLFMRGRRGARELPPAAWGMAMLVAASALTLHCPLVPQLHLHLGHGLVSVALLGAALSFEWRSRRSGHRSAT